MCEQHLEQANPCTRKLWHCASKVEVSKYPQLLRNRNAVWLSLWDKVLEILPMEMGESISNQVLNTRQGVKLLPKVDGAGDP